MLRWRHFGRELFPEVKHLIGDVDTVQCPSDLPKVFVRSNPFVVVSKKEHLEVLWSLENLRPEWHIENLKKYNAIDLELIPASVRRKVEALGIRLE